MKLLFDENLSPRLVRLVAAGFPGSVHVRDVAQLLVAEVARARQFEADEEASMLILSLLKNAKRVAVNCG